jgi:hypothetical protein
MLHGASGGCTSRHGGSGSSRRHSGSWEECAVLRDAWVQHLPQSQCVRLLALQLHTRHHTPHLQPPCISGPDAERRRGTMGKQQFF